MRKILPAAVAVFLVFLSGCSTSLTNSENLTGGESAESGQNSVAIVDTSPGNNKFSDGEVVFTYDKTVYSNVSCESYYNIEYLPLGDEDAYLKLYTQTPEVTYGGGGNIFYDAGGEWGMASPQSEHIYRYSTVRGQDMQRVAYAGHRVAIDSDISAGAIFNYEKCSTELELDFISRADLKVEMERILDDFTHSELYLNIYAVTADEYRQMAEDYDKFNPDNEKNTEFWHLDNGTHIWSEAADFYCIYGTQIAGGMGIFAQDSGDPQYSARRNGFSFNAIYTDKGLEYLYIVDYPLKIGEAVPAGQNVISLEEAEQIITSKFAANLLGEPKVFSNVDFRYLPIENESDITVLTPVWKFWNLSFNPSFDGSGFTTLYYGDVVYINAFTGEEIR